LFTPLVLAFRGDMVFVPSVVALAGA
jgi:hypothetical protein